MNEREQLLAYQQLVRDLLSLIGQNPHRMVSVIVHDGGRDWEVDTVFASIEFTDEWAHERLALERHARALLSPA